MKNIFRLFLALFILSIAFQNAEASKPDTVWRVKSTVKEPKFTYCFKPNADGKRFDTVSWTMPKGFTLYENECFAPAPIKGVDAFVWEDSVYLPISVLDSSFDKQGKFKDADTLFFFKYDTIETQAPLSKSIFKRLQLDTADGQRHLIIAIADSVTFDSCLIINQKNGICAMMKPGEEKNFSFEELGLDSLNDTCVLFRISPLNGTPLYMTWPTDFQTESDTTTAGKKGFAQFMSKFWWVWLIVAALLVLAIVWWLSHRNKDQNPDNPMLAKLGDLKKRILMLIHDGQNNGQNEELNNDMQKCLDIFEASKTKLVNKLDEIEKSLYKRNNPPSELETKVDELSGDTLTASINKLKELIKEYREQLIDNPGKSLFDQLSNRLQKVKENLNPDNAESALDSVTKSEELVNKIEDKTNRFLTHILKSLDSLTSTLKEVKQNVSKKTQQRSEELIKDFESIKKELDSLKVVFVDPEDPEAQVSQTQPLTLSETQAQIQTQTKTQAQAQPTNFEDDKTVPTLFNRFATELDNLLSSVTEAQPEPETVTIAETSSEEMVENEATTAESGSTTETEAKPEPETKSEFDLQTIAGTTKSQLEALKVGFASLQSEVERWIKKANEVHRKTIEDLRMRETETTTLAEKVRVAEDKINKLETSLEAEKENTSKEVEKAKAEKDKVIKGLEASLKAEKENTTKEVERAKAEKDKVIKGLEASLKAEKENTSKEVEKAKAEKDKVIKGLEASLKAEKENTVRKVSKAREEEQEHKRKAVAEKQQEIDQLKLDQKFYTDNFTRVAFAQAYAKKLQQLFKTVAAIESKANGLMAGNKMDDPYYLYRAQAKYNQNMGGIKTALASEVDMMARGQLVFKDSKVVTDLDRNNPEASLKKYLFNAYLEKYFNAVVVFNESLIGLPYFDQKLKENDVKEFKTLSTQLEKDAEALDVEIATVHIKDRNTFSDVTANPVDVDGFASGEIVSLENCKVWIKGGRKPDSRIKIFVQK